MSKHSKVIEFGSKANADGYIAVGWELIETRAEPFALGKTIIVYRVGWPECAGDPVMPPTDDDPRDLEEGPSANRRGTLTLQQAGLYSPQRMEGMNYGKENN